MIDPSDPRTKTLDFGASHPTPAEPRDEAAPGVPSIAKARTEARLQVEFDLVRVHAPVYVLDKKAAAARTAGAERVAKHRQKLADEGMRPTAVPVVLLDQVKAAGGWNEWQAQKLAEAAAKVVPPAPVEIEKRVEVPGPERLVEVPGPERVVEKTVEVLVLAKLGRRDTESLNLGRALQKLTGWRRALVHFALGDAATPAKE
jgi:hypothetical protein